LFYKKALQVQTTIIVLGVAFFAVVMMMMD